MFTITSDHFWQKEKIWRWWALTLFNFLLLLFSFSFFVLFIYCSSHFKYCVFVVFFACDGDDNSDEEESDVEVQWKFILAYFLYSKLIFKQFRYFFYFKWMFTITSDHFGNRRIYDEDVQWRFKFLLFLFSLLTVLVCFNIVYLLVF